MFPQMYPPVMERHGPDLLTKDEILALPQEMPDGFDEPGIYFLVNGDEIVYIGRARQLSRRLVIHYAAKRYGHVHWKWDSVRYLIALDGDEWESRYIRALKPMYNIHYTR